jgi:hypothetical protein
MNDYRILGFRDLGSHSTSASSPREWGRRVPLARESGAPPAPVASDATPSQVDQPILREAVDVNMRQWFSALAGEWHRETAGHSSMTMRKRHPAYQKIVDLGPAALPLLLRALRDMPDIWFPMLIEITKANPVKREDRGDYRKMADAWTTWGREKGYVT